MLENETRRRAAPGHSTIQRNTPGETQLKGTHTPAFKTPISKRFPKQVETPRHALKRAR